MSNINLNVPQLGNRFYDYRKDCWGDSYNWDFQRSLTQVGYLVIHHSVTNPTGKDGKRQVDEIGEIHKSRGFSGFGYHFVISTDGIVWYVGDIGTGRANVANHNEAGIGICLVGDFTKHLPTDIQINSAHDLCDFFLFHYPSLKNVNDWDDVIGHKDAAQIWNDGSNKTACPGSSWPNDMKWRITTNTVYTPSLTPLGEAQKKIENYINLIKKINEMTKI